MISATRIAQSVGTALRQLAGGRRKASASGRAVPGRRRIGLEPLETRMLLTAAAGDVPATRDVTVHYLEVDTLADTVADDGVTSLREAVEEAYGGSERYVITFDESLAGGTIVVSEMIQVNGLIEIRGLGADQLTIAGPGGYYGGRVFRIYTSLNGDNDIRISDLTVTGGQAADGGGFYVEGGSSVELDSVTIRGNRATNDYGTGEGGGIFVDGSASVTMTNCSVIANTADSGAGVAVGNSAELTLINCTITGNVSDTRGGGVHIGDFQVGSTRALRMVNTIVAGNTAADSGADVFGTLDSSSSNNFIGSSDGMTGVAHGTRGNLVGTAAFPLDAGLVAVTNAASEIWAYRPGDGSAVINMGSNALAVDADGVALAADQTGATRIVGGTIDIGAYERTLGAQPVAAGNHYRVTQGGSLTGNVASNDLNRNAGGTLTATLISNASHGTLSLAANGFFSYQADGSYLGFDTFTYQMTSGGQVSNTATVTIFVGPVGELTVTTATDESDGDFSAGDLSLREAILLAAVADGTQTIRFGTALDGQTIAYALGQMRIDSNVNIVGLGRDRLTLDAQNASRLFLVLQGITASFSGMTLQNGLAATADNGFASDGVGGGIYVQHYSTITLDGVTVAGCTAHADGGGLAFSSGVTVHLDDTIFSNNLAREEGGGLWGFQWYDQRTTRQGTLGITDSTFDHNTAYEQGGGVSVGWYVSDIRDSLFTGNHVVGDFYDYTGSSSIPFGGGGLHLAVGTAVVSGCTFLNNTSGWDGGGIYINATAVLTLINSTLSGNTAVGAGGGLRNWTGTATVTNCTITANQCTGEYAQGGGINNTIYSSVSSTTLHNTIVAGNTSASGPDVYGTLVATSSFNLIGIDDGAFASLGVTHGTGGNLVGSTASPVAAGLGTLTELSDRVWFYPLLAGSAAINAGSTAKAVGADGSALAHDQRGGFYDRVVGIAVDIGAIESGNSTTTVTDLGTVELATRTGIALSATATWFALQTTRDGQLTAELAGDSGVQVALYDADLNLVAQGTATASGWRFDATVTGNTTFYVRAIGSGTATLTVANLVAVAGTTVTVHGTTGNDVFAFVAGATSTVTVGGIAYTYTKAQASTFQFIGGQAGSLDTVTLTGCSENETAELRQYTSTLTGTTYSVSAAGMAETRVLAKGGTDVARFYDSTGDDAWGARQSFAQMTGTGFLNRADGFDEVYATATGGTDLARFWDSTGADTFTTRPTWVAMDGASCFAKAIGFDRTQAYSTAGGEDTARFYDSAGNDTLTGSPTSVTLSGTGYTHTASGFRYVHAFATAGGTDTANLSDSAGDDTLNTVATDSTLSGTSFSIRTRQFATVVVDATAGGNDTAYLYGSAGNDTFDAGPLEATLSGAGFEVTARSFDTVESVGKGGSDTATLRDSSGNDTLYADRAYARLVGSGFFLKATRFATVDAYSTAGNDVARLSDSGLAVACVASPTQTSMALADVFHNTAHDFAIVRLYGTGNNDTADLTGSASQDTLWGNPGWCKLYNAAFFVEANNFQQIRVHGTSGGNDSATLTDTAGNDLLTIDGTSVGLSNGTSEILLDNFASVVAAAQNGGTNTKHVVTAAALALTETGTWVEV